MRGEKTGKKKGGREREKERKKEGKAVGPSKQKGKGKKGRGKKGQKGEQSDVEPLVEVFLCVCLDMKSKKKVFSLFHAVLCEKLL